MAVVIDKTTYRSPNYDPRPPGTRIESIVVHTTEGTFPGDIQWLCSKSSGVSCHYVIAPDGLIYSIVSDGNRAWHAGESSYAGKSNYNTFSIGIEVSHLQNQPYGAAMYPALTGLCQQLIATYPTITRTYVVMHRQVATPYGRKIDPTNISDTQFSQWADSLYIPAARRFEVLAPCAIFTDRRPDAALADGPDDGQTRLQPGDVIEIGDITDGWLWITSGIGFFPSSYARPL